MLSHVLNKFPNLSEQPLDLDHVAADLDVVRLRADGVGLSAHLLDDELELTPRAFGLVDDLDILSQVRAKANNLFGNVSAFGEDRNFSDQVAGLDGHTLIGNQALHSFGQAVAV